MHVRIVIKAVLEHLGNVTVDCLPDPRTVSYFAYELGIISDLRVGEILYDNDNVTLSWDLWRDIILMKFTSA